MNHFKQKIQHSPGQALVEFALVITAVLMMIFLIIESGRILWAWNSVQHAAREGARYATTGRFDGDPNNCPVDFGHAKFRQSADEGGRDVCGDLRLASVISTAHNALSGMPLDETSTTFEDDNYYNIEVWGANTAGQLQYDFAGIPNSPVVVRVMYQVPIITPFFQPIRETIPVFGQETLNNEPFGQLSSSDGEPLPPNLPPLPTPGVTPSPTPTPIYSPTPSPTPITPTPSPTVVPVCGVHFEGVVVETQDYVLITGEVGAVVTIVDLTEGGQQIGVGTLAGPFDNHVCDGFSTIPVPEVELIQGHMIAAIPSVGLPDYTFVLGEPPTPTPTATYTPLPSPTPSPTVTPLPSATPLGPHIVLLPTCGTPLTNPGPVTFNVIFVNWPVNQSLILRWEDSVMQTWQANQHAGSFTRAYTRNVSQLTANYAVSATSGGGIVDAETFIVPCSDFPTPTPPIDPTDTPAPPDIVVYGPPVLISTPPIVAYQPVQFTIPITNEGDVNVDGQFWMDLYLDPNPALVLTTTIPITESDGYSAIWGLAGGETKVITITAPLGFTNEPEDHHVYGFADSLEEKVETDETNNITDALIGVQVTPAATPTPSPTPGGEDIISGGALTLGDDLILQYRATLRLVDDSTGSVVGLTTSDQSGYYEFTGVAAPTTTYTVVGCLTIDGESWYGLVTGVMPPTSTAHVIMLKQPCPY